MSRRRRRKRRSLGEVELNLAAMLDMAFQLLTFFILTFRPAPVEGQVNLRLPPPQPVTQVVGAEQAGASEENPNPVQGLTTLVITVLGKEDGSLHQIAVGDSVMGATSALDNKLESIFSDPGNAFDQVILQVGSTLHYDDLMQVVDVCTRQTLPNGEKLAKLSFVESPQ
jgi:biopolymer transport protein ExbD